MINTMSISKLEREGSISFELSSSFTLLRKVKAVIQGSNLEAGTNSKVHRIIQLTYCFFGLVQVPFFFGPAYLHRDDIGYTVPALPTLVSNQKLHQVRANRSTDRVNFSDEISSFHVCVKFCVKPTNTMTLGLS